MFVVVYRTFFLVSFLIFLLKARFKKYFFLSFEMFWPNPLFVDQFHKLVIIFVVSYSTDSAEHQPWTGQGYTRAGGQHSGLDLSLWLGHVLRGSWPRGSGRAPRSNLWRWQLHQQDVAAVLFWIWNYEQYPSWLRGHYSFRRWAPTNLFVCFVVWV